MQQSPSRLGSDRRDPMAADLVPCLSERPSKLAFKRVMNNMCAEPFRPYRIRTTDAKTFEIRQPDGAILGKSSLTLSTFMVEGDYETREARIPFVQIDSIEPLEFSEQPHDRIQDLLLVRPLEVLIP